MREALEHRAHLLRVVAVFGAGLAVFLILRSILVPQGFGELGHYRSGALKDVRARPAAHAPRGICVDCHTDVGDVAKKGKHAALSCQSCHGPLASHAADPEKQKPAKLDVRATCLTCHTANVAKPAKFPQIDPAAHGEGEPCQSCHQPHDPMGDAK